MNKTAATLIDWDDTLFPTKWYANNRNKTFDTKRLVSILDLTVNGTLEDLIKYSDVYIVTNASMKWFNKTLQMMPKTYVTIVNNIKVVSARDKFKNQYPQDPGLWKKLCFQKIFENTNYNIIISVGDSNFEKDALISIWDNISGEKKGGGKMQKYFKTVKMLDSPSIRQLHDQLRVIKINSRKLLTEKNNRDLILAK